MSSDLLSVNVNKVPALATPAQIRDNATFFGVFCTYLLTHCRIMKPHNGKQKLCVDGPNVASVTAKLFAPDLDSDGGVVPGQFQPGRKPGWTVTAVTDLLTKKVADVFPVYPGKNKGFPRFAAIREAFCEAWNLSGDPSACSSALGLDEWGRVKVSVEKCQTWYDMHGHLSDVPDPLIIKEQVEGTEVGTGKADVEDVTTTPEALALIASLEDTMKLILAQQQAEADAKAKAEAEADAKAKAEAEAAEAELASLLEEQVADDES